MEPITIGIIVGAALFTGIVSFFTAKEVYEPEESDHVKQINNQLIIEKEQDNSHEFAQTIVLAIMAIVMITAGLYVCFRHIMYKVVHAQSVHQRAAQQPAVQQPAAQPQVFDA